MASFNRVILLGNLTRDIEIKYLQSGMAVAEIDAAGGIRPIETLSQAVTLGKDTFTQRRIRKQSIEECVRVLKSYRKLLAEYGITRQEQMRVVATSALREARNSNDNVRRVRPCEHAPLHCRRMRLHIAGKPIR